MHIEMSAGVVHGDEYEKPHGVIYYVAQLFAIVFHLCPTQFAAKGPDIYFTVRKCQLFNWRRFQDRAEKKKKKKRIKMSPVNFSKFMPETISCVLLCDLWTAGK